MTALEAVKTHESCGSSCKNCYFGIQFYMYNSNCNITYNICIIIEKCKKMSSKIKFLLCEGKHPCLYDFKNTDYKDQQIRDNIFNEVSYIIESIPT